MEDLTPAKFIALISENVRQYDENEVAAPLIGGSVTSSLSSILSSYIVPPETWRVYSNKERRANWVTPRIPDNVDVESSFTLYTPVRLAYVEEYNYQRTGVRGLFKIERWAVSNWGLAWVIGRPISPSLYNYQSNTMGVSGARFAILARNTTWVSAAIGGFTTSDSKGEPAFFVHYQDDGVTYRQLNLPYKVLAEFVYTKLNPRLQAISWPERTKTATAATTVGEAEAFETKPTPGTTPGADLINETFDRVKMQRFWPQFMIALEMALFSGFASEVLRNTLSQQPHWAAIESYLQSQRNNFEWIPPEYHSRLGKKTRPKYLE